MLLILCFVIIYIIKIISSQEQNYCDLNHNCNSCTFCGVDTNDYCSCNFYNGYCLTSENGDKDFSSNFLLKYDGCLTNNANRNVCGSSDVSVKNGETTYINFISTSQTNFVCYYLIKPEKNSNKIEMSINKNGNQNQNFNLYIITYQVNSSPVLTSLGSSSINNNIQITKSNIEKLSIYFDVSDGQNLDKMSLSFLYNENSDETTTVTTSKSSGKSNTGLIIGIIVGVVALIVIIIVSVVLCKRCRKKRKKNLNINNSSVINNMNNSTLTPQYMAVIRSNREKLEYLFKNELKPKLFNKNKIGIDNKCTICMENFINNSSVIITTKCNHSFHEKCFKNWSFKNIINPKCPNCNYFILGPPENNLENITIPSTLDYTVQTNANGTTSNFGIPS